MFGIILLILGVVGLAVPEQFQGQDVIALVLLLIGAVLIAVSIIAFVFAAAKIKRGHDAFRDRLNSRFR